MEAEDIIINKVALSGLITFDLEEYYTAGERVVYDIKDNLYMGLILKEKDFREFLKQHDWEQYRGKHVAVICSEDAIVPTWAYMLLTLKLEGIAANVYWGDAVELESYLFVKALQSVAVEDYRDKKVVVKGCSKVDVPTAAYVELTRMLQPVVQSLMFGEPCSTVPLYKKPKAR